MPDDPIKLSPSDLTFLWDECPRCFYLKHIHGILRPAAPFPSVFGAIDRLMKAHFAGRPAAEIDSSLPPGVINVSEKWVESLPITLAGHTLSVFFRGKTDATLGFDDGSYGVVDFKTSEPKPSQIPFYSRQLHAYAYALEHPAPGKLLLSPISRLGLLVEAPHATWVESTEEVNFHFASTWLEIPYAEARFLDFIEQVVSLLELPEPPLPSEKCAYCQYRQHARQHGM
jgi:hypothetical protein